MYHSRWSGREGLSLVEVLVSLTVLTTGVLAVAQLFTLVTASNTTASHTTRALVLASQKLEELRTLAWAFDSTGQPITDTAAEGGEGPGLAPSPAAALRENTEGSVDYIDAFGRRLGGGRVPPAGALYTRRWSIVPLPSDPDTTLIVQVLVTRRPEALDAHADALQPGDIRLVTLRTRVAR